MLWGFAAFWLVLALMVTLEVWRKSNILFALVFEGVHLPLVWAFAAAGRRALSGCSVRAVPVDWSRGTGRADGVMGRGDVPHRARNPQRHDFQTARRAKVTPGEAEFYPPMCSDGRKSGKMPPDRLARPRWGSESPVVRGAGTSAGLAPPVRQGGLGKSENRPLRPGTARPSIRYSTVPV